MLGGDIWKTVNTDTPRAAFGEQLSAELHPQFQGTFEYTVDNTELNTNTIVNGGTVTQATGMGVAGTSTTTASTALLSSRRHARYKAGLGGLARFTALFASPVAATEQLIGLADETGSSEAFENGYMLGYIGTVFGFHRFQNDVVTTTALSAWDDPLDGTGASREILDPTKLGVWYIQFQYLGGGAIKVFNEISGTGKVALVLTVPYANINTVPSVYNPNFYFCLWANNKATTSDIQIKTASYGYYVEGKTELIELHQPQFSSEVIEKTSVTTETALFTIRNKTTYASKTNFIELILEQFSVSIEASSANNLGSMRLVRDASLGGVPSYADINTSDSIVDIDVAGTTVTGGKTLIATELAGKNDKDAGNVLPYKIILDAGETITVAVSSANSATFDGILLWKELF